MFLAAVENSAIRRFTTAKPRILQTDHVNRAKPATATATATLFQSNTISFGEETG